MMKEPTWKPYTKHGLLSEEERDELPDSAFAFPKERRLPLTDGSRVISALARFHQVEEATDDERDQAFLNIKKAAEYYEINVPEESWKEVGKRHGI